MTLSATGDAETPAGGSVCMRYEYEMLAGANHFGLRTPKNLRSKSGTRGTQEKFQASPCTDTVGTFK